MCRNEDSAGQLLLQSVASRTQLALLRGEELPSKCKASKKHKDKKRKKDKDRGGVSKCKSSAAGTAVERLREERRQREAAEHIRQQRVLQQPLVRCGSCRNSPRPRFAPKHITCFMTLTQTVNNK